MATWGRLNKIVFAIVILSVIFLAIGGAIYRLVQEKLDEHRYRPAGELVNVGGFRMHIYCIGQGSPAVILDPGLGMFSLDWALIQPKIAKFTRVCSYDRAGYGWSDEGPLPRTSQKMTRELDALLTKVGVTPPYIYVGHSLGGFNARIYAQQFPDKVAGLVLVDPPHEKHLKIIPPPSAPKSLLPSRFLTLVSSYLGIERLKLMWWADNPLIPSQFPTPVLEKWLAKNATTKQTRAWLNEIYADEESNRLFESMKGNYVKNKRVVVISSGKLQPLKELGYSQEWVEWDRRSHDVLVGLHKEIAGQATWGKHVIAEYSDHLIPWKQPDIIVDAVYEIVKHYRKP